MVLSGIDFIKIELDKIIRKEKADGDASILVMDIKNFLSDLKQSNLVLVNRTSNVKAEGEVVQQEYKLNSTTYIPDCENAFKATIYFEEGCEMEDIRAFGVVQNLKEFAKEINHIPEMIFEDKDCIEIIRRQGFKISFKTEKNYEEMNKLFMQTALLRSIELVQLEDKRELDEINKSTPETIKDDLIKTPSVQNKDMEENKKEVRSSTANQNMISVNVSKLDKLMDMVGELVISESMVVQNPDLMGLSLDNFQKAARQLQKITSELQDIVMSIRMVPLDATFQKMNRIVRDMSRKLSKEVMLKIEVKKQRLIKILLSISLIRLCILLEILLIMAWNILMIEWQKVSLEWEQSL